MNLLQHIKDDRKEKKRKAPYEETLFSRIGAVVRSYSLDGGFLEKLEIFKYDFSGEGAEFDRIKTKPRLEMPLFSLLTREEYRVTQKIIDSVHNPYIQFANSPDEILLANSLFSRTPSLSPETLERHHLETLLLCDVAREKLSVLKQRRADAPEQKEEGSPIESAKADASRDRIERLEAFIDGIEKIRT